MSVPADSSKSNQPKPVSREDAILGMREALINVIKATHSKMDNESSFLYRLANTAVDIFDQTKDESLQAVSSDMLDALYQTIPFIEDELGNTIWKPGYIAKQLKNIKAVIAKAENRGIK